MKTELLRVRGLSASRTEGCQLKDIYLDVYEGECLGIFGLHDAGKSFLCDCLQGMKTAAEGTFSLSGELPVPAAKWKGSGTIARVRTETALVDTFSVMENLFVIRGGNGKKFMIPWKAMRLQTMECLEKFDLKISPDKKVFELYPVERHELELLKAWGNGAKLVIMDDITAPYSPDDYKQLRCLISKLEKEGMSFIICSCRPEPVLRLTERTFFMKDGRGLKLTETGSLDLEKEIRLLTGNTRGNTSVEENRSRVKENVLFTVVDSDTGDGKTTDFQIHEGEIVVLVDLFQRWTPEMVAALTGEQGHAGKFCIPRRLAGGKKNEILVVDFLKSTYVIDSLSFRDNLCLAAMKRISVLGIIKPGQSKTVERLFREEHGMDSEEDSQRSRLSFSEKMAVFLERLRLQKWNVLVGLNIENVMSYEMEPMMKQQLREMTANGRALLLCVGSFERFADLADCFIVLKDGDGFQRMSYEEVRRYYRM